MMGPPRTLVLRLDESTLATDGITLFSDLAFLRSQGIRPVVVAPSPASARAVVRLMNRTGDTAVGLSGADAGMIPAAGGPEVGAVQTRLLNTLLSAGYVPVIEPLALGLFGGDVAVTPDVVASALAQAIAATRAIFFNHAGGVIDTQTQLLIDELTPAEALALADEAALSEDLRSAIRAAALGVRGGVGAAQIIDGRIARRDRRISHVAPSGNAGRGDRFHRMKRLRRALSGALLAVAIGSPAAARAEPPVSGFHSTGTLVIAARIGGSPLSAGGDIALYRRGSMYRLDLLSLAFPGTDSSTSTIAGALLAPGGATLIYDGSSGTVTAYSTANRVYYEDARKPVAGATPAPAPGAADPLAALAGVVRQLHDVQRASIQLTGHSTTNGHPTDDLDVLVRRQLPGKSLEDYHAQLELADDLDGFPVRILFSSTPPNPQDFGGSLRLDLTAVARETPDAATFEVPAGYARVPSLGQVLQAGPAR